MLPCVVHVWVASAAGSVSTRTKEDRFDERHAYIVELHSQLGTQHIEAQPPTLLLGCKMEPQGAIRLRGLCVGDALRCASAQSLRQRTREGTPRVGDELLAALAAVFVGERLAEAVRPEWLARMRWQREGGF